MIGPGSWELGFTEMGVMELSVPERDLMELGIIGQDIFGAGMIGLGLQDLGVPETDIVELSIMGLGLLEVGMIGLDPAVGAPDIIEQDTREPDINILSMTAITLRTETDSRAFANRANILIYNRSQRIRLDARFRWLNSSAAH